MDGCPWSEGERVGKLEFFVMHEHVALVGRDDEEVSIFLWREREVAVVVGDGVMGGTALAGGFVHG